MYDIAIIGAGITGTAIARELSRFNLKIIVFEKEVDVGSGVSKANTGIIHAGVTTHPNSLMASTNIIGAEVYEKLSRELHVPYHKIGALIVAFNDEEKKQLESYLSYGQKIGLDGLRIINQEEIRKLEPCLTKAIIAALVVPSTAVINPYQMVIGLAENAYHNGVTFFLAREIEKIVYQENYFSLFYAQGNVRARYVINAAGVYADHIARLIGDDSFTITARKGEYFVLDRSEGPLTQRVIYPVPTATTKGILITPAVEGNTLLGPNAEELEDKTDFSTTTQGMAEIWAGVSKLVTGIPAGKIIAQYSGLRPASQEHDFIIDWSPKNKHFLNVAGIQSPGLSAAPGIAVFVRNKLAEKGLKLTEKKKFTAVRYIEPFFNRSEEKEQQKLWQHNHDYGHIICRCELVARAEILAALNSPFSSLSLDMIKRRTRAGQGRCQGAFCTPRILEIMAEVSGKTWDCFTKKGHNSWLVKKK